MDKFIEFMRGVDCAPHNISDIIADDKRHYYRISGDKPGQKKGSYQLKENPDGFMCGWCMSQRDGENHSWHSKSDKKVSDEERKAYREQVAKERAIKEREIEAGYLEKAEEARKNIETFSTEEPEGGHPYLNKKQVKHFNGLVYDDKDLIVKMVGDGVVVGFQRILPNGQKFYLSGVKKKGSFFPLFAKDDDKEKIIICEGLATGLSIREAVVNIMVICAFDSGNLMSVVEAMRKKYAKRTIYVVADNDQWTFSQKFKADKPKEVPKGDEPKWAEWREEGKLVNIGVDKAAEAVGQVGGFVFLPPFPADMPEKLTDFNDYHVHYGLEKAREVITEFMEPRVDVSVHVHESVMPEYSDDMPDYEMHYLDDDEEIAVNAGTRIGKVKMPFNVLGYNDGIFYYYPFSGKQIIELTASGHTLSNLIMLAPVGVWQKALGGEDGCTEKQIPTRALNILAEMAFRKGVFKEADKVRGAGVWKDDGRTVVHCGDELFVDAKKIDIKDFQSEFTYTASQKLFNLKVKPLNSEEGTRFKEICEMPSWESPLSGSLLAGWIAIAPLCPILKWRPHIWVTGQSASGKSTVEREIIKRALGNIPIFASNGATESSLRERIGYDGRPLIYDEAEPSPILENVMLLSRGASDGQYISKRGQKTFKSQFMACFLSVDQSVQKYTDESRISTFVLKRDRRPGFDNRFENLLAEIADLMGPDFSEKLLYRSVLNLENIIHNIDTFGKAARTVLKAGREAGQIAPMLAGLYSLVSDGRISPENAEEWVRKQSWGEHTSINSISDPDRLMEVILNHLVKIGAEEITISEMCTKAIKKINERENRYGDILKRYGIKIFDKKSIVIANNNPNLLKALRGTNWEKGWARPLREVVGAEVMPKPMRFVSGAAPQRCVKVPFLSDDLEFDLQPKKPVYSDEVPF